MNIFVLKNGEQLGPDTLPELNHLRASGQIQNSDMAWHDEIPDWVPVSQIVGLTPQPLTPATPPAYGSPVTAPVPGRTPVGARVITALAIFVLSFGFFFIVIYMIACVVCGGILGAQATLSYHASNVAEMKANADAFSDKDIPLIAGCSALASFVLSGLLAWGISCSNLLPWCRRT